MSGRLSADMGAAFLIGALFGVGATLLLRLGAEEERHELMRLVQRLRRRRRRAGRAGRIRALLEASRDRS